MNRRDTVLALLILGAPPFATVAQQVSRAWRVGFLSGASRLHVYEGLLKGMQELGYIEGQNLVIEWQVGNGNYERVPALASDLVRAKVDVIVAAGSPAVKAAKEATTSIPIVMVSVSDPVVSGYIPSLSRPGGNITGLSNIQADLSAKFVELLKIVAPQVMRYGVLWNPSNPAGALVLRNIRTAAERAHTSLVAKEVRSADEFEGAFIAIVQERARAIIVVLDGLFLQHRQRLADLAIKHRLASVFGERDHAFAGGLLSYGQNLFDQYRLAANFVHKILKGTKPQDLPVEQPTSLELVINLRTAETLGIAIPKELLLRADEVIR